MCNDPELMIGYLYGELSAAESRSFEAHLAGCVSCRHEVSELRGTRAQLSSWAPPEPDFGFRIVRGAGAPAAPARRGWFAPAWGLAAAAVLVLAAAAAIAHVEVRYDANGLTVRTGWAGDPTPGGSVADGRAAVPVSNAPAPSAAQLAGLEARLRGLEAAVRQPAGASAAAGPRMPDAEMIRRVREMVSQSETRQQREFALQLAQVVADVDRALQVNFARINQGMGQHRAQTQAEIAAQVNYYLTRVSNQK
jgi:Putative zinc-finger